MFIRTDQRGELLYRAAIAIVDFDYFLRQFLPVKPTRSGAALTRSLLWLRIRLAAMSVATL